MVSPARLGAPTIGGYATPTANRCGNIPRGRDPRAPWGARSNFSAVLRRSRAAGSIAQAGGERPAAVWALPAVGAEEVCRLRARSAGGAGGLRGRGAPRWLNRLGRNDR